MRLLFHQRPKKKDKRLFKWDDSEKHSIWRESFMKTGRKESDFEGGLSEEGGIEGSIQFRKSRDQLWLFHPEFYANPWG